ncbi:hypothetical protein R6Q57_003207 [Mikania cordata]
MNPRPNNPNPDFNPFSYDPESIRKFYAQLQQNPNIQHFQPNFQPPPNFQPGFAAYSQPRIVGNVFSGVTIVGKGFQWGDDVTGNFSGKEFSVGCPLRIV